MHVNAWIVDGDGVLRTRDTQANILRGVTRTTLIDLARRLRLQTVAEWVQDEQAATMLTDWGCDYLQGALVGLVGIALIATACGGGGSKKPQTSAESTTTSAAAADATTTTLAGEGTPGTGSVVTASSATTAPAGGAKTTTTAVGGAR